jgi:hypothetical protein
MMLAFLIRWLTLAPFLQICMAAKVSDEQRQQVRTALREAGVNQETVDEIDDGDIDKLYNPELHLIPKRLSL